MIHVFYASCNHCKVYVQYETDDVDKKHYQEVKTKVAEFKEKHRGCRKHSTQ